MSIQLRDRIIRIQHGQELKLQVSNEICCEHSFMNPAFRQALGALLEVLRHTEAFNQEKKDIHDKERGLFEYSGNIILFAAPRGGGKTRMMLSFSHILEHPDAKIVCCSPNERCVDCDSRFSASKDPDRLKECLFFVTTPIAPAAMENGQNVLYVVLSRLYRYAEQLLDGNYANNRVSESKKNELFMAFHHCLSGINGLKQNNASPEDFTILQDISDGLSLRYHFYCLVEKILEIAAPQKGESSRYLVLQFDDADSKIDNVYTVFEDIRKYLLIPNLVILMSADVDFLHSIITQDHLKRFPDVLKYIDHDYSQDIGHIARKYIDKLIPPSHLIYLPEIYRIPVVEAKQLKLLYLDKDGKSMLNPGHEATISDDCNLDISLLNLIYQKTGILFVCPSTYLHNIIPGTLRGLNQLLYLLSEMEDIPEVKKFAPASAFIEEIAQQCKTAQRNIALFADYFMNDWIKVKIKDFDDQEFLEKFINAAGSRRFAIAIRYLERRYPQKPEIGETDNLYNLYFLNQLIYKILETHYEQRDYLLVFTIQTLLTLDCHRLIWQKKYETVRSFQVEMDEAEKGRDTNCIKALDEQLIAFPFSSMREFFPSVIQQLVKKTENNIYRCPLSVGNYYELLTRSEEKQKNDKTHGISKKCARRIAEIFCEETYVGIYEFNLMNIFFLLLYLDDEAIDIATLTQNMDNEERQRELYRLQEYGSMIAANWDVLGKIYRETPAFNKDKVGLAKDSHITYDMLIKTLFKKIHELIPLIHFSDEVCEFKIMKKLKDSCSAVYDQALESRESPDDLPTFTEPKAEDKGQLVTVRVDENQLKNLMTNLQFTFQSSFTSGKRFD